MAGASQMTTAGQVLRPRTAPTLRRLYGDRRLLVALLLVAASAVAAISLLGQGLWIVAKAHVAQALIEQAWVRNQAQGSIEARPWAWADTRPVARLRFVRQQASMIVLAGDSGRTLAFGPGWAPTSALPGRAGNTVISGHRDTHFALLRGIAPGDPIDVETVAGTILGYRVTSRAIVDRSQVAVADDHGIDELTLVTCWPFDALARGGPLRLVVSARRMDVRGSSN